MGTHSLTYVLGSFENPIIAMYGQYDGYPEGMGKDLADFLSNFTIVNGIGEFKPYIANGMGCLAAQIVANFKTEPGGIYLQEIDGPDLIYDNGYTYVIAPPDDGDGSYVGKGTDLQFVVYDGGDIIYDGTIGGFFEFLKVLKDNS